MIGQESPSLHPLWQSHLVIKELIMEVVHEKSVSSKIKYGKMIETVLCGYKYSHSALIHNY